MRKVQFEEMFPWELAQAMARAPICYLPLGILEWHGEHCAVGLDGIKAHAICIRAAQQSGGVVVPPLWWANDHREDLEDGSYLTGGVEIGERYHVPGNMFWLRPETHLNLLLDVYEAMWRRGFLAVVVLSGHWARRNYLPLLKASGERFLAEHPEMKWLLLTDQELASDLEYPHEHAAGGETSILLALRPDLVDLSRTFETAASLRGHYQLFPEHVRRRLETEHKYIGVHTGVVDDSNDPERTASRERGGRLVQAIAERLAARSRKLL